jgi:arylamine N-acetyltransferase
VIEAYLRRLGVPRRAPSAAYLHELHRAHVGRIPYTNMEILLGRPGTVAPEHALRQITTGRGGYCFQLNGAFSELLRELGFTVSLHRGYVVSDPAGAETDLNHLALLVHGLPGPAHPDGTWLADAGLGDALHDPLPLRAGEHPQGPFSYALGDTLRAEPGWRLRHDPSGSFAACDIAAAPAVLGDFAGAHEHLSTSPRSPFTGLFSAQRRTADGVQILRSCVLTTHDAAGRREEHLATRTAWREALADVFGLTGGELDRLWPDVAAAYEKWAAQRAAMLPATTALAGQGAAEPRGAVLPAPRAGAEPVGEPA